MAPRPQLALLSKDPAAAYARQCLVTGSLRECHAGTASELTLALPAMLGKTHSSVNLCASVWFRVDSAARVITHSDICVPRATRRALLTFGPVHAAGQYLLSVTAEGFHVPGSPFVLRCVAAAPTADRSAFEEDSYCGAAGQPIRLVLITCDAYGNECGGAPLLRMPTATVLAAPVPVPVVTAQATPVDGDGSSSEVLVAEVRHEGQGCFSVLVRAEATGLYRVAATMDGRRVPRTSALLVTPGPMHAPSCTVDAKALGTVCAGDAARLVLQTRDALHNLCGPVGAGCAWEGRLIDDGGGAAVAAAAAVGDEAAAEEEEGEEEAAGEAAAMAREAAGDCGWAAVADRRDGSYVVTMAPRRAGPHVLLLTPTVRGMRGGDAALRVPFEVCPGAGGGGGAGGAGSAADAAGFTARGTGLTSAVAGEPASLLVLPASYGAARAVAARGFEALEAWVECSCPCPRCTAPMCDAEEDDMRCGGGGPVVAVHKLRSPVAALPVPLAAAALAAQGLAAAAAAEDEPLRMEAAALEAAAVEAAADGAVAAAAAARRGARDAEAWVLHFTCLRAAPHAQLHITSNGSPVAGAPFRLDVRPAPIAPRACALLDDAGGAVTAGEALLLNLELRDRFGNAARPGSGAVVRVFAGRHETDEIGEIAAEIAAAAARAPGTLATGCTAAGPAEVAAAVARGNTLATGCAAAGAAEAGAAEAAAAAATWAGTMKSFDAAEAAGGAEGQQHSRGCDAVQAADGRWRLRFRTRRAGRYWLTAWVDGVAVGAPRHFEVRPAVASAAASSLSMGRRSGAAAGGWAEVLLMVRDAEGNGRGGGGGDDGDGDGDHVACAAEGCGAEVTRLEHCGGGVYACRVRAPEAGVVTLSGHVGGLPVRGSPLQMSFDGGPTLVSACAVTGDGWHARVRVGVPLQVTVRARDAHGNAQSREGGVCALRVTPQAHAHYAHVSAVEREVGVHECTYTLHFSGKYLLALTLDGTHVPGSPLQIEAVTAARGGGELPCAPAPTPVHGEQRPSRARSASSLQSAPPRHLQSAPLRHLQSGAPRGGVSAALVGRSRSTAGLSARASRENRKKQPQWRVQFMGGGVQ